MGNIIDLDISNSISMTHFEILTTEVGSEEDLRFTFTLQNVSDRNIRLDIRYEIVHPEPDGRKVARLYRISNRKCPTGFLQYNRHHTINPDIRHPRFVPIPCELRIVVNGKRLGSAEFEVIP